MIEIQDIKLPIMLHTRFIPSIPKVDYSFVSKYKNIQPKFDDLAYITFKRTYARKIGNRTEEWIETLERVMKGFIKYLKDYYDTHKIKYEITELQKYAERMFDLMWNFKMLPPGRGLWMCGTEFVDARGSMPLYNCSFLSTDNITADQFALGMEWLMLGVGLGYDVRGANKITIQQPSIGKEFIIPDNREGWCEGLKLLLNSFFKGDPLPLFNYSQLRPKGSPIKGFGGVASGPGPLEELYKNVDNLLRHRIGLKIRSVDILDIYNYIAKSVISGNVRRCACLSLGFANDYDYVHAKEDINACLDRRWASNDSVIMETDCKNYSDIINMIKKNGEPGIVWLDNVRNYSRMIDPIDYKDKLVMGLNPCITGDTLISVADGRNAISIKQLMLEGKDVPVYCKDNNGIIQVRIMRNPRITGYKKEIYQVLLDDGSIIKTTYNHKFILKNKKKRDCIKLKPNDILMSKIKDIKVVYVEKVGYEDVYNGTVDEFHNYGIVLNNNENVFVANCGETALEDGETCNLFEVFPSKCDNYEEFEEALHYAYLYTKTISLLKTKFDKTDSIMERNHRIGISQSGIIDAFVKHGKETMIKWCDKGYKYICDLDKQFSSRLNIGESIKKTVVKPSGCQVKETLIETKDGILTLEEIGNIKGNQWQDIKLKTNVNKDITKFYINGEVDTKKIITNDGNELECSLNHKYIIYRGDPLMFNPSYMEWIEGKDIREGDYLVSILDSYNNHFNVKLKTVPIEHYNNIVIKQPTEMNEKLAWFLGLVYGDGSVHEKGLRISFNRKQSSLCIAIKEVVNELFDLNVTIDDDTSMYINSTLLLTYLKENNILKSYCEDLIIPKAIRCSSKFVIQSFLNGFWRADGGIHNQTTWSICTVSKKFALSLLVLCRSIGINVKIKSAGPGGWGSLDRWIITSRDLDNEEKSKYRNHELRNRYSIIDNIKYWLDPVKNIINSKNDTYDISVPDGNEYIANSIISHNTISLLAGVSAGIHYPHSEYYIRRVRFSKNSELLPYLKEAGYPLEEAITDKETVIASFPKHEEFFIKGKGDVSVREQLENVALYQKYWADNQISITATFKKEEENQLNDLLIEYSKKLKTVAFLPLNDHGYKQAPYETISKEEYEKMISSIKPLHKLMVKQEGVGEKYCNSSSCINTS